MKVITREVLAAAAITVAAFTGAEAGYLYVFDGDTAGNQIFGFSADGATGELSPLPGSPWVTGGVHDAGLYREMLVYSPADRRLYAINAGSASITAFVVNIDDGSLDPLPFSPIALPGGSWRCLAVHPGGSPLIVGDDGSGQVAGFVIGASSAVAAPGSPFASGTYSESCAMSRDGGDLYTGSSPSEGLFAGFEVDQSSGVLTPLPGSPYDPGWSGDPYELNYGYATDRTGRLFMVTYSHAEVLVYATATGVPTAVTGSPFTTGLNPASHGILHDRGYYIIASGAGSALVGVFAVNGDGADTSLAAVPGSPFATGGSDPRVMALSSSGELLFVAHSSSRNVATFAVDQGTGVLSALAIQTPNAFGSPTGVLCGLAYVQGSTIFADDFETGDTTAWSAVVP